MAGVLRPHHNLGVNARWVGSCVIWWVEPRPESEGMVGVLRPWHSLGVNARCVGASAGTCFAV